MCVKILLADDNEAVRFWVRLLLERNGFTVVAEVGDGEEAVRLAQKFHCDIAILDISMPRLNGIQAAEKMRSVSPATKTIIMSVHDQENYILAALRSGGESLRFQARRALGLAGSASRGRARPALHQSLTRRPRRGRLPRRPHGGLD